MRTTRTKPRRTTTPRCKVQRCNKRAEIAGWCISHAERRADDMFSVWVRQRDEYRCTAAGVLEGECKLAAQAAHVVGRANHTVRYDPRNVHSLCQAHHMLVDQQGHEAAKYHWAVWLLGETAYQELMDDAREITDRRASVMAYLEGDDDAAE